MSEKTTKLPVLLIASLCVNALLIGAVAAGFHNLKQDHRISEHHDRKERSEGHKSSHGDSGGPFEDRLARAAFEGLSSDQRKAFRKSLAEEWKATRSIRDASMDRNQELIQLLAAETFDREAASDLLAKNRDDEDAMRKRRHDRLLDLLESLPTEQRQTLVLEAGERMQRLRDKVEKFRNKHGDQPPGDMDGPPPPPPGRFDDRPPPNGPRPDGPPPEKD